MPRTVIVRHCCHSAVSEIVCDVLHVLIDSALDYTRLVLPFCNTAKIRSTVTVTVGVIYYPSRRPKCTLIEAIQLLLILEFLASGL